MSETVQTYTSDSGALAPDRAPLPRSGPPGQLVADIMTRRWAMDRNTIDSLLASVRAAELATVSAGAVLEQITDNLDVTYKVIDGVAVIPVRGIVFKQVPWIYEWFGIDCADTTILAQWIELAAADPAAKSILVAIDSPGGEVAGTHELAQAVYDARAAKPVHAYIEDLGASAAYWIASQAQHISANRTAAVGSIGVYAVLDDVSGAYREFGIVTHVVKSAPYKGTGVPGTEVTEEQLLPIQEEVDGLARIFIEDVARGRGATPEGVDTVASGRTWLAGEAVTLGLIDAVETDRAALDRAAAATSGDSK